MQPWPSSGQLKQQLSPQYCETAMVRLEFEVIIQKGLEGLELGKEAEKNFPESKAVLVSHLSL